MCVTMAARYLLSSSTSENGSDAFCQLQQKNHYQEQQRQNQNDHVYHHQCCVGHTQRHHHHHQQHLDQSSANTHHHHHTQHHSSSTTIEDIKGDATTHSTYPPPPPPATLLVPTQEKGRAVVSTVLPAQPPSSANTQRTQFSFTALEGATTFSSLQEAAASPNVLLPPPSSLSPIAMPDPFSMHTQYNGRHYQQTCQNGDQRESVFYRGMLAPSQPQSYPTAAMASTTTYTAPAAATVAVPLQTASSSPQHLQLLRRHEPLYGCGCGDCVTFFSSPGHGYLSPLTHFSDEASSCHPPPIPPPPPTLVSSEAIPPPAAAASSGYTYNSSFPPPTQVVVRRFSSSTFMS